MLMKVYAWVIPKHDYNSKDVGKFLGFCNHHDDIIDRGNTWEISNNDDDSKDRYMSLVRTFRYDDNSKNSVKTLLRKF